MKSERKIPVSFQQKISFHLLDKKVFILFLVLFFTFPSSGQTIIGKNKKVSPNSFQFDLIGVFQNEFRMQYERAFNRNTRMLIRTGFKNYRLDDPTLFSGTYINYYAEEEIEEVTWIFFFPFTDHRTVYPSGTRPLEEYGQFAPSVSIPVQWSLMKFLGKKNRSFKLFYEVGLSFIFHSGYSIRDGFEITSTRRESSWAGIPILAGSHKTTMTRRYTQTRTMTPESKLGMGTQVAYGARWFLSRDISLDFRHDLGLNFSSIESNIPSPFFQQYFSRVTVVGGFYF